MYHYESIKFGMDLVKASQAEYDFLLEVQGLECLRNDAVLQNAIRRYESLWLPLVASKTENIKPTEILIPPIDIAWVWHCHMLAPHKYAEYCLSLFGKVIDHSVTKSKDFNEITKSTWLLLYPNEPFEMSQDIMDGYIPDAKVHKSKSYSFDLLAAVHRQQDFVYNIHLPHYRDTKFLKTALTRYKKYLFLKKKNPTEFLVPCYDIDLIWHTHQLHPIDYERVTKSLLDRLLIHDDTDSDRNPGSKLSNSYGITCKLWNDEYAESFATAGTMYRGDTPKGRHYLLATSDIENISGRKAVVVINSISISKLKDSRENVKLKLLKTNVYHKSNLIRKLSGKMGNLTWNNQNIHFSYGPTDQMVDFELYTRKHFFRGGSKIIGGFQERFWHLIHNSELQIGDGFKSEGNMQMQSALSEAKYIVSGRIEHPIRTESVFILVPGDSEAEIDMPTNADKLWGPVPLLKSDAKNICHVASHRLRDSYGKDIFTCRIIHSVKLMTSVVQVFFQDKMAAIAHVIGTEHLPMKSQISGHLSLNPTEGERAILIKTGEGDSMIMVGKWTGFVRGVAGQLDKGKRGIHGNPGHLKIKVFRVSVKPIPREETISLTEYSVLNFEGLTLDFNNGIITCSELKMKDIILYVCFSFSIALLHVLCVPRPANWKPGESIKPKQDKRGSRKVERFPDEDISFLMAAGLQCLTPSNHYIYNNSSTNLCAGCTAGEITSGSCDFGINRNRSAIDSKRTGSSDREFGNAEYGGSCGGCGGCGSGFGGCVSVVATNEAPMKGGGLKFVSGGEDGSGKRDKGLPATDNTSVCSGCCVPGHGHTDFGFSFNFHTSCFSGGSHFGGCNCGGHCD